MKDQAILTRLAARVFNTPLMIHPDKLNVILGAIGNRFGLDVPEKASQDDWFTSPQRDAPKTEAALAVIPVYGTLVHRTSGMDALSGLRSYGRIREDFREALEDPVVTAIVLDIDSAGGEVAGAHDLADEIYKARGNKPIYAVANEMAYSAAYLLASAAEEIFIPRTGGMGSIGVIAVHVDQSGWDEQKGLKYTPVFAGAHKNDFSPHHPLSDEALAIIQAEINETWDLFVDTVARNRALEPKDVKSMEAGIFMGRHSVEAGLADQVMSWDQALEYIVSTTNSKGGFRMNQEELRSQMEALLTTPGLDADAVLETLGYVPKSNQDNVEQLIAQATEKGRTEAMDRVTGILDLCKLAGRSDMAEPLVKIGCTVEDARKQIIDAKASDSGKDEIVSTVGALTTGELNPVLENARKRADAAKR
jgi:signal peptide peptidase SppA